MRDIYFQTCASNEDSNQPAHPRSVISHTIVQLIFRFLWAHWAHCGILENGVLLTYTLAVLQTSLLLMTILNKTEAPIF